MDGVWRKAVTILLIVMVAYVFISPALDLDPSANRAWRAALQTIASMAATASILLALIELALLLNPAAEVLDTRGSPDPLLYTCVCIR